MPTLEACSKICRSRGSWFAFLNVWLISVPMAYSQATLGSNLIVNGGAEAGQAGTPTTVAASIPGWSATGGPNVVLYNAAGVLQTTNPAPPDHGFQYFVSGPINVGNTSSLTQDVDVSALAGTIAGGNVKFVASAYLGSTKGTGLVPTSQVAVAFKNGSGQIFSTATVGPLGLNGDGLSLQQQTGLVPPGTVRITVTLTLNGHCLNAAQCASGSADNVSLILNTLDTSPGLVLGVNMITNGGAEAGPSAAPGASASTAALYVPGWSTANAVSVAPYGGTGWLQPSDPGPVNRGVNLFRGGLAGADAYQDLDVSAAAVLIDASQVKYTVSGWLGGVAGVTSPTVTYTFFDWSGRQLAATANLGPLSHTGAALVLASHSDALPAGTRRVRIQLNMVGANIVADNLSFVLSGPGGPPVISPGGVVSAGAFGGFTTVAPGTWIEIYGMNLSSTSRTWAGSDFNNGVAPTALDGVSVAIGGKAAFVDSVSPGQVNALVPSDAPVGPALITVSNGNLTSEGYGILVNPTQPGLLAPPAFQVGGRQYLAALFPDGQTFTIPANAITGVPSRAARVGDILTIYGIGFGPVTGGITAGTVVTQSNSVTADFRFFFGTTPATVTYSGLVPSFTGLYQFNVTVPTVPSNAASPVSFTLGGVRGTQTLFIAVQNP